MGREFTEEQKRQRTAYMRFWRKSNPLKARASYKRHRNNRDTSKPYGSALN